MNEIESMWAFGMRACMTDTRHSDGRESRDRQKSQ
jgi:hypothetical protein